MHLQPAAVSRQPRTPAHSTSGPRRAEPRRRTSPVVRRRTAAGLESHLSGERIDTLILQGLIVLAMAGMAAWFHQPLAEALRSLI
jgi:hypothetical protein